MSLTNFILAAITLFLSLLAAAFELPTRTQQAVVWLDPAKNPADILLPADGCTRLRGLWKLS